MKDFEIVYEYVNVSASDALETFIKDKLATIKNRYDFVIRADVFLKLDNKDIGSQHHCGIRLSAPGPRIYASSDESDFEQAISETIRDLKDQLEKRKAKMSNY